jgi:nicotinamide mononucleotide transporter
MDFLSIDNIFFTLWNYPVSYLEFAGLILGVVSVLLASVNNTWTWPLGIVYVVLMMALFYQVRLYPDMMLHFYFFVTNIIGWWRWKHPQQREADQNKQLRISFLIPRHLLYAVIGIGAGTVCLGVFAANLHNLLPFAFTAPSAAPYVDSFITIASIVAAWLLIQKKIEAWLLYLFVDIVGVFLYFDRDIKLTSLLYFFYCLLATFALINWIRIYKRYDVGYDNN